MTRFLLTADLHQFIPKWEQLVEATFQERPDFVLIAGELLPKTPKTAYAAQREFFSEMRRHLIRMKNEAGSRVLLYLDNDDDHPCLLARLLWCDPEPSLAERVSSHAWMKPMITVTVPSAAAERHSTSCPLETVPAIKLAAKMSEP